MSKKKDQKPKEKVALTEWQQRNLEFLKKKKEEAAEKEQLREKLLIERRESHQKTSPKTSENSKTSHEKSLKKSDKKQSKKEKQPNQAPSKATLIRRRKLRRATPILLLSLVTLLISIFLVSPWSKQKTVKVIGYKNALEDDILTDLGIKKSDYFFTLIFKHKYYENAVEANNDWIKRASLTYEFPNRFTLAVKEREIVAYTQVANGYQPILENGKRIETVNASEMPKQFVTINLKDENQVQELIKSFAKVKKSLVKQIQTVTLAGSSTTPDLLLLAMQDGNTVRLPLSEFSQKFPYYEKIKGKLAEPSIVDMEVGIYTTTAAIEEEAAAEKSETKEKTSSTSEKNDSEATNNSTVTETSGAEGETEASTSQTEESETQTQMSE